jgi:molybdenum cofactor synthesis domain-containing protein
VKCGYATILLVQKGGIMFTTGVLTISTKGAKGQRQDISGEVIKEMVSAVGGKVVDYAIVTDDKDIIANKLIEWADRGDMDVILSTGGTGLSETDITPEATLSVIEKLVPGIPELVRMETVKKTPTAVLSRAVAGVRKKCLIINMPGSPRAVKECLEIIQPVIQHAVDIIKGVVTEHGPQHAGGHHHGAH